jgi:hypothetical protein
MLRCYEALSLNENQYPSKRTNAESIHNIGGLVLQSEPFFLE